MSSCIVALLASLAFGALLRRVKKSFTAGRFHIAGLPSIFLLVIQLKDTRVRNLNQDTITQAVIARLATTPDARLKEIMTSLVQHLHAFAREVKLTEPEWMQGIEFLTATGQMCNEKRQEFILLSDTLGLSMLTVAMNNDKPLGCTEPTVFGPFFLEDAPRFELGADVGGGAKGEPCRVRA
jgi:hydroxyquinol 1,2-dioxygenase